MNQMTWDQFSSFMEDMKREGVTQAKTPLGSICELQWRGNRILNILLRDHWYNLLKKDNLIIPINDAGAIKLRVGREIGWDDRYVINERLFFIKNSVMDPLNYILRTDQEIIL